MLCQQTQCSSTLIILVNSYYGPFSRTISVLKSTGRHASSIGIASYDALGHVSPPPRACACRPTPIWQFLLTYNLQWEMVDCYWTQHITVPATFHTESVQFCSLLYLCSDLCLISWTCTPCPLPSPRLKMLATPLASRQHCRNDALTVSRLTVIPESLRWMSFTDSAVALHCVKAHRQSQRRSPNFNSPSPIDRKIT